MNMNLLRPLAALFRKRKQDAEMTEELRAHVELRTRRNLASGMSPEEARYAAHRSFGGEEQIKERCRDERVRGLVWLEQFVQDVRYAARTLRKNPGFATVVVLTLALGIGANTAIFSVVHAVLLRGLPYNEPERVMRVLSTVGTNRGSTTAPDFVDWRSSAQSFEGMAAVSGQSYNLIGNGEPERISGARVSANYFEVLGLTPILGRAFTADEDKHGANRVALIGNGLWQRRYAGNPSVLGATIVLDREPYTIVGVLPAALELYANSVQVWTPLALTPRELGSTGNRRYAVTARLRPGVTREKAEAEMQTIARAIAEKRPNSNKGWGAIVVPIRDQVLGDIRQPLLILFGAVACVLLIACANVGNLLLARGEARHQEIAVRAALGAGRVRIARQLLTESLLLALLGGALGLWLASIGIDVLVRLLPATIPRLGQVAINGTVLVFTLGTVLLTGVLFGLAPSMRAARTDLNDALKKGGRTPGARTGKLRSGLVVAEMALALVLLIGAGLLARSFWRILSVDTGLRREPLVALQTSLPESRYPQPVTFANFGDAVLERLHALPDVQSVGLTSHVPLGSGGNSISVTILGRPPVEPQQLPNAHYRAVSAGYFSTLGIPVVAGRGFDDRDRASSTRVAVINQTMAQRLWPKENPIGHRFLLDDREKEPVEIVGVVANVKHFGPAADIQPEFFVPFAQGRESFWRFANRSFYIVVQPRGEIAAATSAVRRAVWSADSELPLYRVTTLQQLHRDSMAMPRVYGLLLSGFAMSALLLAAIGIYGVMAYTVAQRTREIGVRLALGASRPDVIKLIVGGGVRLALLGGGIGLLAALALTRLIASQLYQVSATDPEVFIGLAVLLIVIGLVACWLPARRAAKVDPMIALRAE
jgi:predicted permease